VILRCLVLSMLVAGSGLACSIPDDPFPVLETPPPPPPDGEPAPPDGEPVLPDAPAFAVLSVTPGDGDVEVARDVAITVQFTARVDPETLEHLHVDDAAGAPVPGAWSAHDATATATFTPEPRLGRVRRYTIGASTELRDVAGRPLSTALVAGFTTRDGAWSAPVMAQDDDGHLAADPMAVCHADGAVDVAWTQWAPRDASQHVVVRRHAAGVWGVASVVSHERARARLHGLAVNRRGGAAAVWSDDVLRVVGASRLRAGLPWEYLGVQMEPLRAGVDAVARAGLSDGDEVSLFWVGALGPMAARLTTGTGWVQGALRDRTDAYEGDLVVGAGGGAAAAWTESRGLVTRVFDPGPPGGWRVEDDIHATVANFPSLGSDASGSLILVWWDGNSEVLARYRAASGPWEATTSLGSGSSPRLAVDPGGTAAATWWASGSAPRLAVRMYRPGAGWAPPQVVELGGFGTYRVALAGDEATAVGTFGRGVDPYAAALWSARHIGGQWRPPVELDENVTRGSASIATCPDGTAAAVWTRHFADGRGKVWMSRFE
jgi:hypothetical protein